MLEVLLCHSCSYMYYVNLLPFSDYQVDLHLSHPIAVCPPKTLFLAIFDPGSSIVNNVFDHRLSGMFMFLYALSRE